MGRRRAVVPYGEAGVPDSEAGGLPKDHPDYAGKVRCTLDHAKALDILAGLWLGVFRDRIAGCYKERGREVDAVCAFRGTWSPKEYNWSHDACDFTLTITREGMDRIIAWALDENRKAFGAYVRRYYRSYDGFISYLPDYVWGYDELREKDRGGSGADGVKHLYWACLNFFLFPDEDAEQWFDDCLCNALWDRYSVFVEEAVIYEEDEEGGEEEAL